jgi:hypothetical protein
MHNNNDYSESTTRTQARSWRPGILVLEKRWTGDGILAFPGDHVGVVLRCYDSNVYEGASVDVLINGEEKWLPIKELIKVEELEDTSKAHI